MQGTKNKLHTKTEEIDMSEQAKNSLDLYRGGNPATIENLLRFQKKNVVDELKAHFGTNNLHELAIRCSIGK